jgi:hypothetical protein
MPLRAALLTLRVATVRAQDASAMLKVEFLKSGFVGLQAVACADAATGSKQSASVIIGKYESTFLNICFLLAIFP